MTRSYIPAFATGKVGRDQVADYARRKGWSVEEAERHFFNHGLLRTGHNIKGNRQHD